MNFIGIQFLKRKYIYKNLHLVLLSTNIRFDQK